MESEPIDPNDIEALKRRIAELEAAQQASPPSGGTEITAGDVSGTGIAIGPGAQASVTHGGYFINAAFAQFVTTITQTGEDPEETKSVIALYLHALSADVAGLNLAEIDASADHTRQSPLELADIFVPLNTTQQIPEKNTLAQWLAQQRKNPAGSIKAEGDMRQVSALEALAEHRELMLLGKPGSGKSTFGASVLLALAQTWQGHEDKLAGLGENWTYGPLLPIRVLLRRFAEQLAPGEAPARAGDIWEFIGRDLRAGSYGCSENIVSIVQRIARTRGALFLLDGLDECNGVVQRERVSAGVNDLMRHAGKYCRFVVTARPYARPEGANPARGVYMLADLNNEQIEQFIRAWFTALVRRNWLQTADVEQQIANLLSTRHRSDLRPLAQNPLLLTLMAVLHYNTHGNLPEDRAELYNDSVDLLMLRWNRQIGADKALLQALAVPGLKLSQIRSTLEKLAFEIHDTNAGLEGTADIGEDRLVRAFRPLLDNSKDKADLVVDYIEKRAGLLLGQGEKDGERQFTFPHRTFQEFLAACYLSRRERFPNECLRVARDAPAHWKVVLPLAARLAGGERGASAADQLIGGVSITDYRAKKQPGPAEWTRAQLAGEQLLEIGSNEINADERMQAIAQRVAGWLVASLPVHPKDGGAPANQRAQAGDVLAALGDPRFDPARFYLPGDDMLGFVPVRADPKFEIGTRKADVKLVGKATGTDAYANENNDQVTPTPDFYISRYPVTVAQFAAFVAAQKLVNDSFEIGDTNALRAPATRPVSRISWHEARDYCKWLNGVLANAAWDNKLTELIRTGRWQVALPSELEWEKAARGGLSRKVFPWGDTPDPERANYDDSGISGTSVVGCFPANNGLYDMSGNVWEWTRSLWGKDFSKPEFRYPYNAEDSKRENLDAKEDVLRVVRGGSWSSRRIDARCAIRGRRGPGSVVGFRVVLRSAPASKL